VRSQEEFCVAGGPKTIAASVIGPLHVEMGLPCQDYVGSRINGERLVVAVADGLGSATNSETGARLAVEAALAVTDDSEPGSGADLQARARSALRAARHRLEEEAAEEEAELRDYACTLIILATEGAATCVAHIGDGGAVGLDDNGLLLLSDPGDSEYTNEVEPLTSDTWEDAIRCSTTFTDLRAVAVFTDGCQRAGLRRVDGELHPHEGFFLPLFSFARDATDVEAAQAELAALLAGAKMSEYSEDDKTLALVTLDCEASAAEGDAVTEASSTAA
jgi:hypothetical protein